MSPYSSLDDVDVLFWKSAVKTSLFHWFGSNPSQYYSKIIFIYQLFTHANIRRSTGSDFVDPMPTFGKELYKVYFCLIQITPVL